MPPTANQDAEHVRLLAVLHYVLAGIVAMMACIPVLHLILGLMLALAPAKFAPPAGQEPFPAFLGWFFVAIASVFILMGWTLAILIFAAGRSLAKQKRHTFCLVIAGLECMFLPLGTILGIFTILVLMRETVKQSFQPTAFEKR